MKYLIGFLILFVASCQYPVDQAKLPDTQKFLVIDAEITEDFARVNVLYSLERVTSNGSYTLPKVPAVTALIVDGAGAGYPVKNTNGVRDTLFKGKIGGTYQLIVELDGKRYESAKETMRPCPELESLTAQYNRESFRVEADINYDGFDVYAEAKDIPGVANFYQWHWINYAKAPACTKRFSIAEGREVYIPCFPTDCWNIIQNQKIIVQSDNLRDGNPLRQLVVRVPFATPPNRYYLRVEQRSITPSVFNYLKSLETQTENVGTLFDIPAQTRFNPNVTNVNDISEKILGVFSVYSYKRKIIYIDMTQTIPNAQAKVYIDPVPLTSDPLVSAPCTEETYRTKIKPEGWVN
ncbi:MAG: DUF4249 domain-containing protein [Saprospiraceae bacterium]